MQVCMRVRITYVCMYVYTSRPTYMYECIYSSIHVRIHDCLHACLYMSLSLVAH